MCVCACVCVFVCEYVVCVIIDQNNKSVGGVNKKFKITN